MGTAGRLSLPIYDVRVAELADVRFPFSHLAGKYGNEGGFTEKNHGNEAAQKHPFFRFLRFPPLCLEHRLQETEALHFNRNTIRALFRS